MIWLKKLLVGYDVVAISSTKKKELFNKNYQRMINMCNANHIAVYVMDYSTNNSIKDEAEIIIKIYHCDLEKVARIVKKCYLNMTILENRGLKILLKKIYKKMYIPVCVLSFLCMIKICDSFIWEISYYGNYKYTSFTLYKILNEMDIDYLTRKNEIDLDNIENTIRKKYPDISFVSAFIEGCQLKLVIKEGILYKGKNEENVSASIIARCDGKIESIITREGTPKVFIGDKVKKNDILVLGGFEILDDSNSVVKNEHVRADADITIRTNLKKEFSFPQSYVVEEYDGACEKGIFLQIGNKKKYIYKPFKSSQHCDIMKCKNEIKYKKILKSSPCIRLDNFYFYNEIEKKHDVNTANEEADRIIDNYIEKLYEKNIKVYDYKKDVKISGENVFVDVIFNISGNLTKYSNVVMEEKIGSDRGND